MTLNPNLYNAVHHFNVTFHRVQTDPIITIGNNNIKRVYKTKNLGIITDDMLNWKENIHSICKKTSKGIGML
jgi:hypothetical protein